MNLALLTSRVCKSFATAVFAALVVSIGASSSALANPCAPAYRTLADDAILRPFVCERISDETIHGSTGPVHITYWRRKKNNPAPYPAALEPLRRRAAATFRLAVEPYETFAPLPREVAVVIGEGLGPWQASDADRRAAGIANAEFDTRLISGQCTIDLNMNNLHQNLTEGGYRHYVDWTAAHELFHCLQALNFPAFHSEYRDNAWWIEGMAEYFPVLVLHDHAFLEFWEKFGSESARRSLFETGQPDEPGYANAPFFAFLDSPAFGSARMLEVWKNIPAGSNWDVQLVQLSAFHLGAVLQALAKHVVDAEIPTRVPWLPAYAVTPDFGEAWHVDQDEVVLAFGPRSATLVAIGGGASVRNEPLHLYRGRANLAKGYRYKITPMISGDMKLSLRQEGVGAWVDAPSSMTADACQQPAVITAAASFLEPSRGAGPQMLVKREACTKCAAVKEHDRCLIGVWDFESGGRLEWVQRHLHNANVKSHTATGQSMTFNADGTFLFGAYRGKTTIETNDRMVHGAGDVTSRASGRWATQGNSTLLLCRESHDIGGKIRVKGPNGFDQTVTVPAEAATMLIWQYSCGGDSLRTEEPVTRDPIVTMYHRRH